MVLFSVTVQCFQMLQILPARYNNLLATRCNKMLYQAKIQAKWALFVPCDMYGARFTPGAGADPEGSGRTRLQISGACHPLPASRGTGQASPIGGAGFPWSLIGGSGAPVCRSPGQCLARPGTSTANYRQVGTPLHAAGGPLRCRNNGKPAGSPCGQGTPRSCPCSDNLSPRHIGSPGAPAGALVRVLFMQKSNKNGFSCAPDRQRPPMF